MSPRTTSTYRSTTPAQRNNLHNHHSSNPCKNNNKRPQLREVPQSQQPPVPPALDYVPPTAKAVPLRPPAGLEHVPELPPGIPCALAKAPPIAPPPQHARQPVAGPQQHGPVGKHHNPARQRPQPQQAGAVLQQPTVLQPADVDNDYIDAYDCYNLTLETGILSNKQEVLTAMKKELDKLRQKDMYEECDKSTLSQEQLRKIVKTCWDGLLGTDQTCLQLQLLEFSQQVNYEQGL